jgi:hypothetical protein
VLFATTPLPVSGSTVRQADPLFVGTDVGRLWKGQESCGELPIFESHSLRHYCSQLSDFARFFYRYERVPTSVTTNRPKVWAPARSIRSPIHLPDERMKLAMGARGLPQLGHSYDAARPLPRLRKRIPTKRSRQQIAAGRSMHLHTTTIAICPILDIGRAWITVIQRRQITAICRVSG